MRLSPFAAVQVLRLEFAAEEGEQAKEELRREVARLKASAGAGAGSMAAIGAGLPVLPPLQVCPLSANHRAGITAAGFSIASTRLCV